MKLFTRIYKKLNLFDKVLIFLAIFAIVLFAYVFFRKSTYVSVVIKVGEGNILYEPWRVETGVRAWFSQLFYQGMKETDGLGRTMAEVISIRSYDTLPSRKAVYLTTNLRAVYERASNQYTFKGKPLIIGAPIKLNLGSVFIEGLVTHVEGVEDPRIKETLNVEVKIREETAVFPETSGAKDYIADALKIGEEIRDDQGNLIIKILNKKVEDAKRLVVTSDGQTFIRTNPLKKDIYLTLEVNAIKIHNRYYIFDDVPLVVGNIIPINTTFVSLPINTIWPEVMEITTFK